jgi:hypothetical protein
MQAAGEIRDKEDELDKVDMCLEIVRPDGDSDYYEGGLNKWDFVVHDGVVTVVNNDDPRVRAVYAPGQWIMVDSYINESTDDQC